MPIKVATKRSRADVIHHDCRLLTSTATPKPQQIFTNLCISRMRDPPFGGLSITMPIYFPAEAAA
jgi:hypothetical protein